MAQEGRRAAEPYFEAARVGGNVVISELLRNMEVGQFEMAYAVLVPCVFTVYLNPADHKRLRGVFDLIAEDARRALRARVTELNSSPGLLAKRTKGPRKEYKIAARDWSIEFLPDSEVPPGDVEIHSELNESPDPEFRGAKTTLMQREPSVIAHRTTQRTDTRPKTEIVYAEIRYEDDSGAQTYAVTQNQIRIGRGGSNQAMDLALYTNDEVSREHAIIRRDPATGIFFLTDVSTNGTWINGKRVRKGIEEVLPARAQIGIGEVLTLSFERRQ